MSNQEMQFADPDWEPTRPGQHSPTYAPQPVNDDRRERFQQPVVEMPPAQEEVYPGYAGAQPEQFRQPPSYHYPQRPHRRHRAWLWIIIAILFFSLMGGGASTLANIGQRSVTRDTSFPLAAGTPTLVINDPNGNIQVHQGNSLAIEEVKHSSFFDDPNNSNVKVSHSGSVITLSVDTGTSLFSTRSVDFNITVPQQVNLELTTNSGDISVNDTQGAIELSTVSGNISALNDTFTGNASFISTSGDIHTEGDTFGSNVSVTTVSGDVQMHQDTLDASAKVNTTSGNIDFDDTLASSNASSTSYQFTTVSGDINVGLPSTANVTVKAGTTSGSIDARDFPTINVPDTKQGSGSQASGNIGNPSGASLTLNTTSGDITIHQR